MANEIYNLESENLKLQISMPDCSDFKSRFDWTGFISRIIMDGKHTFCVPDSLIEGEGTGGKGLCNEFLLNPEWYNETNEGERFMKIGIGLLLRPDGEKYSVKRPYNDIIPFPITIDKRENYIKFIQEPLDCRGYAVKLEKTIKIAGRVINIEYNLCNTGSRTVHTSEYCHNFFAINNKMVGSGYKLILPYSMNMDRVTDVLDINGRIIRWRWIPDMPFFFQCDDISEKEGFSWEMYHEEEGVGIREHALFDVSKFVLWGKAHVISPETYIDLLLEPGEAKSWERRYEFFYLEK